MLILLLTCLTTIIAAADSPSTGTSTPGYRIINIPNMIKKEGLAPDFFVAVLSLVIFLGCIFPSSRIKKYQGAVLTGANVYFFIFENLANTFVDYDNFLFLIATFLLGIVLYLMPSTKMMVVSISSAYPAAIILFALSGIRLQAIFFIFEVLIALTMMFLLSTMKFAFNLVFWTSSFAYLLCLFSSATILDVFNKAMFYDFVSGNFMTMMFGKLFIALYLAIAFFLPGILKLSKKALFGSKDKEDVDESVKATKEEENI